MRTTTWSVASRAGSGISSTWRVAVPTTGAPARLAPQPMQVSGACTTMRSGSRRSMVLPGDPGCLPGARAALPSALLAARRSLASAARRARRSVRSLEGGSEELPESLAAWVCSSSSLERSSSISAAWIFSCSAWASTVARNRRISASYSSRSGSNTSAFYQAARAEWWIPARPARIPARARVPEWLRLGTQVDQPEDASYRIWSCAC